MDKVHHPKRAENNSSDKPKVPYVGDKGIKTQSEGIVGLEGYLSFARQGREEIVAAVCKGFSIQRLREIQGELELTREEIANFIGVSGRTLSRRQMSDRLDAQESDKLARLELILARATVVFNGDEAKAIKWIKMPARGLGGETPLAMCRIGFGYEKVMDLLTQIEYGVYI